MREKKTVLISVALVIGAVLVAYYLFVSERDRQLALRGVEDPAVVDLEQEALLQDKTTEEASVTLYFFNPFASQKGEKLLRREERTLFRAQDPVKMARLILNELAKGPTTPSEEGLTAEASSYYQRGAAERAFLRQLFLLKNGTLVIDITPRNVRSLGGGILAEQAFVLSITKSLRENVPEVKRVKFIVNGTEHSTLAGHVSISEAFM